MTNIFNSSDYRYEKKFHIDYISKHKVRTLVKLNPFMFKEIYHKRFINNIYFDSHSFINYKDNIEGQTNRIKIRIRWYGDLFGKVKKPILELKIKKGLLGKKLSYKLPDFVFNKKTNILNIINKNDKLLDSEVLDFKSVIPTLLNRYSREYYISSDKKFRITVDDNMSYYNIHEHKNSFNKLFKNNKSVILELKYAQKYESEANIIMQKLPFRVTKSSKYLTGLEKTFQTIG